MIEARQDGAAGSKSGDWIVLDWAPQKVILAHLAVKVFVTHCGWNGTLETLSCGVPVVAWTVFTDQLLNGEWLDRFAMGKLIRGTGYVTERYVAAEEIAAVLGEVADKAKGYRANALPNAKKSTSACLVLQ